MVSLRYLLDTNTVIEALRRRDDTLRRRFVENDTQMAVSTVTVAELAYGSERSSDPARNRRAVDGLIGRLVVLDLDMPAAEHSGQIRAQLAAKGTPIGPYDLLIAGQARAHGLIVVTNNVREFSRVDGLRVEDWTTAPR